MFSLQGIFVSNFETDIEYMRIPRYGCHYTIILYFIEITTVHYSTVQYSFCHWSLLGSTRREEY